VGLTAHLWPLTTYPTTSSFQIRNSTMDSWTDWLVVKLVQNVMIFSVFFDYTLFLYFPYTFDQLVSRHLLLSIILFLQVGYALCAHLDYRVAARHCGSPVDWHVGQDVAASNELSDRHKAFHHPHSRTIPLPCSDVSVIFFSSVWSNAVQMLSFIYYQLRFHWYHGVHCMGVIR
jgi:hypothetical protein